MNSRSVAVDTLPFQHAVWNWRQRPHDPSQCRDAANRRGGPGQLHPRATGYARGPDGGAEVRIARGPRSTIGSTATRNLSARRVGLVPTNASALNAGALTR